MTDWLSEAVCVSAFAILTALGVEWSAGFFHCVHLWIFLFVEKAVLWKINPVDPGDFLWKCWKGKLAETESGTLVLINYLLPREKQENYVVRWVKPLIEISARIWGYLLCSQQNKFLRANKTFFKLLLLRVKHFKFLVFYPATSNKRQWKKHQFIKAKGND